MVFEGSSAAISHTGKVRSNNQDSGYAGSNLFVVADGMGGHAGGDVASSLAVTRLEALDRAYSSTAEAERELQHAIADAAADLIDMVRERPELAGMGTTVSALGDGRRLRRHRAHRRLAHLPLPRRPAHPDHHRPHLRAAARRVRPHHRGGGAVPPAALGADAGARRHVVRPRGRHLHHADAGRRPMDAVLRRPLGRRGRRPHRQGPRHGDRARANGRQPAQAGARRRGARQRHHRHRRRRRSASRRVGHADDRRIGIQPHRGGRARRTLRAQRMAAPEPPGGQRAHALRAGRRVPRRADRGGSPPRPSAPHRLDHRSRRRARAARRRVLGAYNWTQTLFYVGADDDTVVVFRGIQQGIGPISLSTPYEDTGILLDDLPPSSAARGGDDQRTILANAEAIVERLRETAEQTR